MVSSAIFFPCSFSKQSLNWEADSLRASLRAGLPSFILSMVSRNSAFSAVRRIISLACAPNIFVAAFRSTSFDCSSPGPGALVFFSYSFFKRASRSSHSIGDKQTVHLLALATFMASQTSGFSNSLIAQAWFITTLAKAM